ncbi:4-hydroxy-tetrahydrodipicolinate synthase [Helicobacter mustelae]|uniref:4-hydroxy-tetrahydrodipicolinate synthase n=1 Tax=Helicobacter mustelae (strain ATCC 43772 / CCUG 25715 / CIP 103759 / LMG 18044 / NCTC 12198 / R85-136P) TaxID=679897 RepID=D3UJI0_HELM1|nr:4-hydroxy-tetrahydrodipicolinate synthase [Helicobacter mustelae]CBG40656.1 dihydrodipicolinate synthase [Helicobacter mustelae 12198]SQH72153.1 dihydrodipicolinate synthase [Helicobacter mustelae]STP13298.1 dihydrodipicolinate synthase [Helicobacter mustelae]
MSFCLDGAMSALITPFKHNKIDESSYIELIKRQIKYGMQACVPVGTTGESATLSHNEHKQCIEIAVETCKNTGVKVLAGAGSNATHEAIELAQFAQKCGADAILCVTPYYNKPTQRGLYEHYKAVANSVEIPLMLYNVPSRTGVEIETATAISLFNDVKNIFAIKEANGSMNTIIELNTYAEGLAIFSGEDSINYPILANGGRGVISVTGNLLPDKIVQLVKTALCGRMSDSKAINNELYVLNRVLFCESNPIPIKACLYLSGLIDTLEYRLPLLAPSKENMKLLEKTLQKYEVLK